MAITTQNIVKDFESGDEINRVLHGINIHIRDGELTMLVGPSGCGKTTLLSILTGILSPTSGEVEVNGTVLTSLSASQKVRYRRDHLGLIFQQFNLLPSLTAAENAAVVRVAAGVSFRQAEKEASEMLERIGMGSHLHKLPSQLSGGQQQRVAIARALVHHPRVLVCDEPTASLDAHSGQLVMDILRQIALEKDRVVLVVTHDNRIFHFADRIFHMDDGRVQKEETVAGKTLETALQTQAIS